MAVGIDELFAMLRSDMDEVTQAEGRRLAKEVKHPSVFLQPVEDKSVWENCAQILAEKTDNELYYFEMFEWLQDMTWPGALTIYARLERVPGEKIGHAYSYCVKRAIKLEDAEWLYSLSGFLKKDDWMRFLSPEALATLKKHREEYPHWD